jgi:peptidoglycan hydrolase-like protein with peptidoglycan-binding domain
MHLNVTGSNSIARCFVVVLLVVYIVPCEGVDYNELVPLPSGLVNQNGHTYLPHSVMMNTLGTPCARSTSCSTITNPAISAHVVTESVGPFRVTGLRPAVARIRAALSRVKVEKPDLYAVLGTAGMACCRMVRGSTTRYSNHAWGLAIDFTINGKLDPRADGKTQRGLLELYPYMSEQGFYWAAGYSAKYEDAMHFEASLAQVSQWDAAGVFSTSSTPTCGAAGSPRVDQCDWPTLYYSSSSSPTEDAIVYTLQYLLKDNGYLAGSTPDGLFGSGTQTAVKAYQTAAHLTADGIVGRNTWTALFGDAPTSIAKYSSRTNAVKAFQHLLNSKYGESLTVDGVFGSGTEAAIKRYQSAYGWNVNGRIDYDMFHGMISCCLGWYAPNNSIFDPPSNDPYDGSGPAVDNGPNGHAGVVAAVVVSVVLAAAIVLLVVWRKKRDSDKLTPDHNSNSDSSGHNVTATAVQADLPRSSGGYVALV